jgi:hypothetical protein
VTVHASSVCWSNHAWTPPRRGDFFGEGALTGQTVRIGTDTATIPTTVLVIEKSAMLRLLRSTTLCSVSFSTIRRPLEWSGIAAARVLPRRVILTPDRGSAGGGDELCRTSHRA